MHSTYVIRIAAARTVQIHNLSAVEFVDEYRVEIMQIEFATELVQLRPTALRTYVVVAVARIDIVMYLPRVSTALPAVKVENGGCRLVEEVAGKHHSINLSVLAKRVYRHDMMELVGLRRHIEMQIGGNHHRTVGSCLLLRRITVECGKGEEQKSNYYHFCHKASYIV